MNNINENKILDFLNKKYDSSFIVLNNSSKNIHFKGYSEYFSTIVFIKCFYSNKRYLKELELLSIFNKDDLLEYFEWDDKYFIVFKYVNMQDIHDFLKKEIVIAAKLIAKFHIISTKMCMDKIKSLSKNDKLIFDKVEDYINLLEGHYRIRELKKIYNNFLEYRTIYENEYFNLKKVVIHGDFGFRNIKMRNNEMTLIDFERAKIDIQWNDFIKVFNREIKSKEDQDIFIKAYSEELEIQKPSPILMKFLDFYTALGIFSYTKVVEDKEFEEMGNEIINHINNFFEYL